MIVRPTGLFSHPKPLGISSGGLDGTGAVFIRLSLPKEVVHVLATSAPPFVSEDRRHQLDKFSFLGRPPQCQEYRESRLQYSSKHEIIMVLLVICPS